MTPGTVIPKPSAKADFVVVGWERRRGDDALIYGIPNHRDPTHPYRKGVTATEFRAAYDRLASTGEITRRWFNDNLPACAKDGPCNFATLGGVFVLLGLAEHRLGAHTRRDRR